MAPDRFDTAVADTVGGVRGAVGTGVAAGFGAARGGSAGGGSVGGAVGVCATGGGATGGFGVGVAAGGSGSAVRPDAGSESRSATREPGGCFLRSVRPLLDRSVPADASTVFAAGFVDGSDDADATAPGCAAPGWPAVG
jgi:hypothetical protein